MSERFDFNKFGRRSLSIVVHSKGKNFARLAEEIESLRQEHQGIRNKTVKAFIDCNLGRRLLIAAIDNSEPVALVDRLYKICVQKGFNTLHSEVYAAIEYAYYCGARACHTKGLLALRQIKNKISASEGMSGRSKQIFLEALEEPIRRLNSRLSSTHDVAGFRRRKRDENEAD